MGSVSSASSNLTNLLQTLGTESPELSSLLSTPQMQSALENASPGDLVQLSDQALQLQQIGILFGTTDGTQSTGLPSVPASLFSALSPDSSTTQADPIMQALESSLGVSGTNSTTSGTSSSTSASSLQAQEVQALFGDTQTVDPLLNTLG